MRVLVALIVTLAVTCSAFGQTYTTQTSASGGLPQNIPGVSASLSRVTWIAVDTAGNVYMSLWDYFESLGLRFSGLRVNRGGF